MSHDAAHEPATSTDHVDSSIATRFLGIVAGALLVIASVGIQHAMGWHAASAGVITGVFGVVAGALGSSVRGPMMAAVLGWAGALAFFTSIAMFVGLRLW
ncbi:MAG: hypothetical protein NTX15_05850 [Candidatus Kapabacteria bacterium]|nr:hypothetical protein [Candidatus Kapabacteria bacterium]